MLIELSLCFVFQLRNNLIVIWKPDWMEKRSMKQVQYLEIQNDKRFTWKQQVNHVVIKIKPMLCYLNWDMSWIKKLWSQSTMQYLNPIYAMLHLRGLKTLISSKDFKCYRKIPEDVFFRIKIPKGSSFKDSKSSEILWQDFSWKLDFNKQIFEGFTALCL